MKSGRITRQYVSHVEQQLSLELKDLADYNYDVQVLACELLDELIKLKTNHVLEIPNSLTGSVGGILEKLNNEISNNINLSENNKNIKELLRKEAEKSTHFETRYRMETKNNETLSAQWEENDSKTRQREEQLTKEIGDLKRVIAGLRSKLAEKSAEIVSTLKSVPLTSEGGMQAVGSGTTSSSCLQHDNRSASPKSVSQSPVITGNNTKVTLVPMEVNVVTNDNAPGKVPINLQSELLQQIDIDLTKAEKSRLSDMHDPVGSSQGQVTHKNPDEIITLESQGQNQTSNIVKDPVNLFMIGDSHAREMANMFRKCMSNSERKITCITKPGRKLDFIVKSIKPDKIPSNSQICLIAGTNDLFCTQFESIEKSFDVLHKKCKDFKILIILVPPRYDNRNSNNHIRKLNVKIKYCVQKYANFQLIDPYVFLRFDHFSKDYVHLNGKGKLLLCSKIINKLYGTVGTHENVNLNMNDTRNKTKRSNIKVYRNDHVSKLRENKYIKHKPSNRTQMFTNTHTVHTQRATKPSNHVRGEPFSDMTSHQMSTTHPLPSENVPIPTCTYTSSLPCHMQFRQPPWLSSTHPILTQPNSMQCPPTNSISQNYPLCHPAGNIMMYPRHPSAIVHHSMPSQYPSYPNKSDHTQAINPPQPPPSFTHPTTFQNVTYADQSHTRAELSPTHQPYQVHGATNHNYSYPHSYPHSYQHPQSQQHSYPHSQQHSYQHPQQHSYQHPHSYPHSRQQSYPETPSSILAPHQSQSF